MTESSTVEVPEVDPNAAAHGAAAPASTEGRDAGEQGKVADAPGADAGKVEGQGQPAPKAETGERPKFKNALEAVEAKLGKQAASPAAKATQTDPNDPKVKGKKEDAPIPPELSAHPRFKELAHDNRTLKAAADKREELLQSQEPMVKTYNDLNSFLSESNLSKDDFASLLKIGAAVRNDPHEAYKMLRPVMDQLESLVGERLPEDLQRKLDANLIDEETARALAKERGQNLINQDRLRVAEDRSTREAKSREERDNEQALEVVGDAINAREAQLKANDPDAAKLLPFVQQTVMAKIAQMNAGQLKPPMTAAEGAEFFDSCVKEVKEAMRGVLPTPRASDGRLPVGSANANTMAVPKTAVEAAELALQGLAR